MEHTKYSEKLSALQRSSTFEENHESEIRYQAIIESQIDLISRYRPDTILTFVNDAYCNFFGKKREELIGSSFLFMVAPEFHELVIKETENLVKNPKTLYGEYLNYRQDGKECWIQWVIQSIVDEKGRVFELQAVGRDITQLKKTEEALRQANLIVESSPVVLFRWKTDSGWPIEYVSNNVSQFGYSVQELITGNILFISLIHPDDRDRVAREVQEFSSNGADQFQQEYRIVTKDGDVRWVDGRTTIERNEKGEILRYQGILIDITERIKSEEEHKKLRDQLHQAQKMETVGRLAGGIAHDFNNILTAILGYTQIAIAETSRSNKIYTDLKMIEQATINSAALIKRLMTFSRQDTVIPKVLDLNKAVSDLLNMLQKLIGEDIEITWMPGSDLWPVMVDPSQIDQILANLFINAKDAIDGPGKITIKSENMSINNNLLPDRYNFIPGEYILLSVSDNGCGISHDLIDNIFDPFFTTKEIGKGTGLGLATVYGIVKQNKGYITVKSKPGEGTVFNIYLPRCYGKYGTEHAKEYVSDIPKGNGETVLLVEDEEAILQLNEKVLENLGYKVLTASTPGEALQKARKTTEKIHLLFTDIIMPEMNGRELAKSLSKMNPDLRLLFSSGYTANIINQENVINDKEHFLQKPFTIKDMATKVRDALD